MFLFVTCLLRTRVLAAYPQKNRLADGFDPRVLILSSDDNFKTNSQCEKQSSRGSILRVVVGHIWRSFFVQRLTRTCTNWSHYEAELDSGKWCQLRTDNLCTSIINEYTYVYLWQLTPTSSSNPFRTT